MDLWSNPWLLGSYYYVKTGHSEGKELKGMVLSI